MASACVTIAATAALNSLHAISDIKLNNYWCCCADVEKLQSMYVRYKCQPEAQITNTGWELITSQRYADQLAAEEQQAYVREESLLYNGTAPTSISLRIIEAPAEFAVPVKQDR
jgi:hypothetical protein